MQKADARTRLRRKVGNHDTQVIITSAIVAILQLGALTTLTAQVPAVQTDIYSVTLSQTYGRAVFRRCDLSNVAVGKISGGRGLARLTCTLQIDPPERDIVVERRMLEGDVEALGSLLERSNLYGGGHTGLDNSASEGPWELLQVRCCGRTDMIVLVTQGNATFENGARRELLDFLHRWARDMADEGLKTFKLRPRP